MSQVRKCVCKQTANFGSREKLNIFFNMLKKALVIFFSISFSLMIFCEYLIYYIVISNCSWPTFGKQPNSDTVRMMFIADTHLLGPRHGHWFDKLRREWQMHRSFQSAITLLNPTAVSILGDVFDEGQWSDSEQFSIYFKRFNRLFRTPSDVEVFVVPGNHDIGFHYITTPRLINQFEMAFNISSVDLKNIGSSTFLLVNSMAFEGDGCNFCVSAERKLLTAKTQLGCGKNEECAKGRPIMLQHFPMYRKSDSACSEPDEAPSEIKGNRFRERWDCLSKEASEKIYDWINPRAIFSGHTHHGCHTIHRDDIHEYSVPSFSWRNKNNPSFLLAVITSDEVEVTRCMMPLESTVIQLYIWGIAFAFILPFLIWLTPRLYLFVSHSIRRKSRSKER